MYIKIRRMFHPSLPDWIIQHRVVSNSFNSFSGIDLIIILSASFRSKGFGDEIRESRNVPNICLSIGNVDDWIGAFIIFCNYFVFSSFANKYSAHFEFHCHNSFLACVWIRSMRMLRLWSSCVSFRCSIKSFSTSDCIERFTFLVP